MMTGVIGSLIRSTSVGQPGMCDYLALPKSTSPSWQRLFAAGVTIVSAVD
jgi:hypothetical protein